MAVHRDKAHLHEGVEEGRDEGVQGVRIVRVLCIHVLCKACSTQHSAFGRNLAVYFPSSKDIQLGSIIRRGTT